MHVRALTESLWSHVLRHESAYTSSSYSGHSEALDACADLVSRGLGFRAAPTLENALWPDAAMEAMRVWPAYVERWLGMGQASAVRVAHEQGDGDGDGDAGGDTSTT